MTLYGAAKAPAVAHKDTAATVAALTDDSGGSASETLAVGVNTDALTHAVGTADDTVDDVTGSFSQTILNNNFKEVTDQLGTQKTLNALLLDHVASLAAKIEGLIDHMNDGRT